jgi:hypothetical protein
MERPVLQTSHLPRFGIEIRKNEEKFDKKIRERE